MRPSLLPFFVDQTTVSFRAEQQERFPFCPRPVGCREPDAVRQWRVRVEPEFNEGTRLRVRQILFTKDLQGLDLSGVRIGNDAVRHFQSELVSLVLIVA